MAGSSPSFMLGSLIGIVVIGGLIDRRGLGAPFLAGIGLFAIGLVVGGLAPSMPVLIAARFVQGLGAGAIPPIAYVAIGRSLPERLRPQMFATLSTAWVLPGVLGPAIAGVVGETIGWRWVFLGLLPLIAVAGFLSFSAVHRVGPPGGSRDRGGDGRARRSAADSRWPSWSPLGTGLFLAGLTSGSAGPARGPRRSSGRSLAHPGAAPADPARDAARGPWPARGRPAPRRPDVHVLRRRRLRRAGPGRRAGA